MIGNTTGSWTTWKVEYVTVNLNKGVNNLTMNSLTTDGAPNIDLISFITPTVVAGGCEVDCQGNIGGNAFVDECNVCVEGTTGKVACEQDCNGDWGGLAVADNCGVCIGGSNSNKACTGTIEAETACTYDGILLESKNEGFSGEGYVNTTNAIGAYVSWILDSDKNQSATISFRYANGGTTSRDGYITINGSAAESILMPSTGSWSAWEYASVNLALTQGTNNIIISATTADGLANIDLITFSDGVVDGMCLITDLVKTVDKTGMRVYPNPTQDKVSWSNVKAWELLRADGQVLSTGSSDYIDVSSYSKGIYFIRFGEEVVKVIKN